MYEEITGKSITAVTWQFESGENLVTLAVENGNYAVMEYLLKRPEVKTSVEYATVGNRYLLYHCVDHSLYDSRNRISGKIQIIKYLVKLNPKLLDLLLNEKSQIWGHSPLFCARTHPTLLLELMRAGDGVLLRYHCNYSLLASVAEDLSSNEFLELVKAIRDLLYDSEPNMHACISKLLKNSQDPDKNLVVCLLKIKEPKLETLTILKECGIDFETTECLLLKHAILAHRSIECIAKLIDLGVNFDKRDEKGER